MGFFRPTTAEIDLGALRHNYKEIVKKLPSGVRIMAMVKADAYGHGAVKISQTLCECGSAALGVATVEEGLELRESGINQAVLVLGGLMGVGSAAAGMMVGANLTPVIHSAEVLDFLEATAKASGKAVGVHLKIDTGMTRLGVMPSNLSQVLNKLKICVHLRLDGVMTHFAKADDAEYTSFQLETFKKCAKQVEDIFPNISVWHVANSTAILRGELFSNTREQWVRPGLALYGVGSEKFKPVMSLRSRIVMIKNVPAGTKISYACTFETKRASRIGVVPIGYADGYPFALSNKAFVLVGGAKLPVVGRVTMDMIMIDLTEAPSSHVGDVVVLMGKQNGKEISVEEIAGLAGTIPYEIFCGISKRMPRVYIC